MVPIDSGVTEDAMDEMAPEDSGVPFPAPFPTPPKVISSGGPVLTQGWKVVPVFYSTDSPSMQTSVEAFLKATTGSPYWKATVYEYGAGDYVVEPTVVIQTPPPVTTTDSQLKQYIASQADGTHAPWPKADPNTLFAMFYPSGTTVMLGQSASCTGFGAYHSDWHLADNTAFPYAVMPRCQGGIDILSASTSHELVEAATDPFPQTVPAYGNVDADHLIWAFSSSGGEVADMCQLDQDSFQRMVGNFLVQRSWSNASAKAGHDPCVPVIASQPYFNAAPVLNETVTLNFGQTITTKGVNIPIGMSKTIDVVMFSDKPTPPWTVIAQQTNGSVNLGFTWDVTQGQNGDILHLTIQAKQTTQYGAAGFFISSTDGNYTHRWYGLVGFK